MYFFLVLIVIKVDRLYCIYLDKQKEIKITNKHSLLNVSELLLNAKMAASGADSAGRFNILSQMEHLQSKYMGTGHADTTKFEWATHQHR